VAPTNGQVLVYNSSTSKWENSSGGYVPYTGAVTTVNLGAQSILAGTFVKAGGTSAQFLKADGSVDSTAYGTGSVTSVGLTMPSAFSVANSPVTTAGTLAVTGAGTVSQYIRGDGSLADFPATTGGGASVSYYLNGSVSQGTIGGVAYREVNRNPVFGSGTDISISSDGYIANFITDAGDPNKLEIPAGNWNLETYFSASSSGGSPSFYVELYKYNGTTFTLIASSSTAPELIAFGTNLNPYFSTLAVPQTTLALTDRLALRYYVNTSGRTITLHTENNHLCQVITTFTTGLTALNGLTTQVQFFAVGTSGTDFAISSASDTHTFNLPTASATNRGALSSADWSTFNAKMPAITFNSPLFIASGGEVGITQASGSTNGFLSSTDWTTFNNKQNALTNPVTGTGTTNYLPKFTGSTTIGNSQIFDNGTNVGIGTTSVSGTYEKLAVAGGISIKDNTNAKLEIGRYNTTGAQNSYIKLGANSNSLRFTNNTDIADLMELTNSGNLGLGVTPSAWTLFSGVLELNGGPSIGGFANTTYFMQNANFDSGFKYKTTGTAGRYELGGQHSWWIAPSGTAGNAISFTQAMTLTSGGNLLVGTTTDAGFKLDVNGTGRFSGAVTGTQYNATSKYAWGSATNGTTGQVATDNTNNYFDYIGSLIFRGAAASNTLVTFSSTGAATFSSSVTATNTITISSTSNASLVAATNSTTGFTFIDLINNGASGKNYQIGIGGNSAASGYANNLYFDLVGVGNIMTLTSGRNVLIGTQTSGSSRLRIVGLPTSSSGLSSGDVWSDSGTLKIA
jgi:hypothetical protein